MARARKAARTARETAPAEEPARSQPQLAGDGVPARPSPARGLQRRLDAAYAHDAGKWSARRTLLFILATCGGFWALVVGAFLLRR